MNNRISPRLFLGLLAFYLLLTVMISSAPVAAAPLDATLSIGVADEAAFFGAFNLDLPALSQVKAAVEAKDWTAAKAAWARHLETRTSPRWLWSRHDKARIVKLLDEKDGGLTRFIASADETLARRFVPQGVPYQLEKNIDWQLKLSEETHVMSRMSYWRDMGYAYWQTGDAKYAEDFVTILNDWIDDNPVPTTLAVAQKPNTRWRTLETGIRADTWWDAMQLFMDAPEFDANAKYRMTKSLMEQARFLNAWNTIYRRGNWQVIEASGLAMTAMMLPEAKESAAWRQCAFDFLTQHMQKDVLPDGAHSEFTPGYHSVVMGQFARIAQMCKLNGYEVPGLLERHEKMYDWLMHISKPDHTAPSIGDARNAKLENDMATGALLYNRSDLRYLGSESGSPSWVWTFGADAFEKYSEIPAVKPGFTSTMTQNSKYLVMRTGWEKNDSYLLFGNVPWGGGHSHNDRLSLMIYAGQNLLVDPGIYDYDQPLASTYFRTGNAHNVLLVDGKEQPKFDPQVLAWQSTSLADFGAGMIEGDGIRQERSVLFVKPGYWVVVDHVTGEGEYEVKRLFHFPIGEAKFEGRSASTAFAAGTNLQVQSADDSRLEAGKGWAVTGAAKAEESPVAVFVSRGQLPMTLVTVLTPFADARALPKVERISPQDSPVAQLRVSFPDGQIDEIAVAARPAALKAGEAQGQGRALVQRKGPQSNETIQIGPQADLKTGDVP